MQTMTRPSSPIRETDTEARSIACGLMRAARFAALAVIHPETGAPHVTRVGFGLAPSRHPVTLVSDLSLHTRALRARPDAALLVGEPGPRGDPLTHPRLTLSVHARFVMRDDPDHPRSAPPGLPIIQGGLYVDFSDFSFVRFDLQGGALNAGFGKAFPTCSRGLYVT